jgi:hypothetical protein
MAKVTSGVGKNSKKQPSPSPALTSNHDEQEEDVQSSASTASIASKEEDDDTVASSTPSTSTGQRTRRKKCQRPSTRYKLYSVKIAPCLRYRKNLEDGPYSSFHAFS